MRHRTARQEHQRNPRQRHSMWRCCPDSTIQLQLGILKANSRVSDMVPGVDEFMSLVHFTTSCCILLHPAPDRLCDTVITEPPEHLHRADP